MHKPHVILAYPRYPSLTADGIDRHRYFPRPRTRYTVLTGAPPIAEQLENQVRSQSGMTHKPARIPEPIVVAQKEPTKPWGLGHGNDTPQRIYLFLRHLADEDLPYIPAEIGRETTCESGWVFNNLRSLEKRGLIRYARRRDGNHYHTVVLIMMTGQIVRSPDAPADLIP